MNSMENVNQTIRYASTIVMLSNYWISTEQIWTALVSMSIHCDLLHVPFSPLFGMTLAMITDDNCTLLIVVGTTCMHALVCLHVVEPLFKIELLYVMWRFYDIISNFIVSNKTSKGASWRDSIMLWCSIVYSKVVLYKWAKIYQYFLSGSGCYISCRC